jgi:predicted PurR-regulated permease PerM
MLNSEPPTMPPVLLPNAVLRVFVTLATTLLAIALVMFLVQALYPVVALLCCVLIVVYLLVTPVNCLETVFKWGYRQWLVPLSVFQGGFIQKMLSPFGARALAVVLVFMVGLLSLTYGLLNTAPLLKEQFGEMGQKISVQLLNTSREVVLWADGVVGNNILQQALLPSLEKSGVASDNFPLVVQNGIAQKIVSQIDTLVATLVPNFLSFAGGTVNGLIYLLAGMLLTFYFLLDGVRLKEGILRRVPVSTRSVTQKLFQGFHQVMLAFVKGQVMLGLLTGAYMFVVYTIFGVPYAFLLAVIFALAEFLPVIGTWIGITVGLTVMFLTVKPVTLFSVWLCSYVYQTLKDNVLAPKVVGDVMGLHPLVIILSLLLCAKLAGLLGVLIALPLASAVNVVLRLFQELETKPSVEEGLPVE